MALILGIPFTISTMTTILKVLSSGGHVMYGAIELTSGGVNTMKSGKSKILSDRCALISSKLQSIDKNILLTSIGKKLLETLLTSSQWAYDYENKNSLLKIIFNTTYKEKFKDSHQEITQTFSDLINMYILSGYEPVDSYEPVIFN